MFRYQFNDFILDSQQHALIRAEKKINLGSIAYKILLYFVNNPNRTIHKEELITAVWENVIITDATLYKQIQRLRDLLHDNGEKKNIIETIHGVGFEFLPEVNTVDAEQKQHTITLKTENRNWNKAIILAFVLIGALGVYVLFPYKTQSPHIQTQNISLYEAIFNMKNAMSINKKAFISQINIRNELGKLLDKRFDSKEKLSWERKFFKYYDKMNAEEHFLFEQIRAYAEGPMFENNQLILDLINHNPKIMSEITLADELRNHLTIWLNKYNKIFAKNKKMALLYVGVEDGAPYPSKVDEQVIQWLENNSQLASNPP